MRATPLFLALAALLLCGLSPAAAADPSPPWEVCEVYNSTECAKHSDKCSLCTGLDGSELCFEAAIAEKLPPCEFGSGGSGAGG